jgi:hypothetical protein
VIAERDALRDAGGEIAHLRDVALDHALPRQLRNRAVSVLHFGRAVPLDGELLGRNLFNDLRKLGAQRSFEARLDLVEVALDREYPRRHRAVDHRHRDLKA